MKKFSTAVMTAIIATLLVVSTAFALVPNGNFENGNFSSWTQSYFLNNGLTGSQPFTGANIVRTAGGSNQSAILGPFAALSKTDPFSPIKYPAYGNYTARVNSSTTGYISNSILQNDTWQAGDKDASDNQYHLRFTYAAVMQDPGHIPAQQPWFYVKVKNLTDGTTLYEKFSYVGDVNNWQTTGAVSGWKYLNWNLVDVIDPGANIGDQIQIEAIAADCAQGGHAGYVYIDEVGSALPVGPTISASGPATTTTGATITYTYNYYNGSSSPINPTISATQPTGVTFTSVSDTTNCSLAGGVVTCNYTGLAGTTGGSFTVSGTVTASTGSTISHNIYSVIAAGFPAATGSVVVTTLPANAAPVAVNDTYNTAFNTALNGTTVLVNDTDAESNPLTAAKDTQPAHASAFTFNSNGTFSYTPVTGFVGTDSFTYHANDGTSNSNIATVTINVTNTAPVAGSDSYNTPANTLLNGSTVLVNDSDADSGPAALTAVKDSDPLHAATFTLNSNGTFSYTPAAGYTGSDSFTYHAYDGAASSNIATVTINIASVPPVAVNDSYNTAFNTALNGTTVLVNDTDAESDPLTAAKDADPAHASAFTFNSNGTFNYTPATGFVGTDSFTYHANDGTSNSNIATVTINVTNTAPVAGSDSYNTPANTLLNGSTVLVNDNDADSGPSALTAVKDTDPSHASAFTLNSDGTFSYTPVTGYVGTDTFTYHAYDGAASSNIATVTINVTNTAPVAGSDSYNTPANTLLNGSTVLVNDNDADSGPSALTAVKDTDPSHASAFTLNSDGTFSYTPVNGYVGTDTFTYHAYDGAASSNIATVTINVTNTAPVAGSDSYNTPANTLLNGSTVLVNDNDADSGPAALTAVKDSDPAHASAFIFNSNGTFSYTPAAGYSGSDSFTYHAYDGAASSNIATVTINIASIPPVAVNDTYNTAFNTALNGTTVLVNDTDAESNPLTAAKDTQPAHASAFTFNSNGTFSYTPVTGFVGTDSFTYHANDGTSNSNIATVTINVTNTAPVAGSDSYNTPANTLLNGSTVLVNDSDADSGPAALTAVKDSDPLHASAFSFNSNGTFSYTPAAGYTGSDSFTYHAYDGAASSNIATVTISIASVPPVTINGNAAGKPGVTLTYDDGGTKTVTSAADGTYTITVPSGWSGTVTPSKANYADFFIPDFKIYTNVTANQVNQHYGAQVTFRPSVPNLDGWVLESAQDSGIGGKMQTNAQTFVVGDDNGNRAYVGILNFWTEKLPEVPVNVTVMTMKLKVESVVGTNPFTYAAPATIAVAIKDGTFGTAGLTIDDFQAVATAEKAGYFNRTPLVNNWYLANFYAIGKNNINMAGNTQFRLGFTANQNNATADYVKFFTGNSTDPDNKPFLTIQYLMP